MVGKIKRFFSLLALYGMMDLRWFTQDMTICCIVILCDAVSALSGISGVFLLSERFGGIGELSAMESLFMLGFYTLAEGLQFLFTGNYNTLEISRRVGRGQVDHMLIQPLPLITQLLTEGFVPISGNSRLIAGLCVVIYAARKLPLVITPLWIAVFVLLVLLRMAITVALSYLAGSAAFYKPVSCEEISSFVLNTIDTMGRYPLGGLEKVFAGLLVTVFPAGLMGWFPAMTLLGKQNLALGTILPMTVALSLMALAQHFFRKGLRYYAKIGSNRYRDMGFRC